MKKHKIIYFAILCLFIGFYSCNNEDISMDDDRNRHIETINIDEINQIIANMLDTTVLEIDSEEAFYKLCKDASNIREQELLNEGYIKVESFSNDSNQTRASVQLYTKIVSPNGTTAIEYSQFKARFSTSFCNEVNAVVASGLHISPSKTYICGWRNAGTYFYLASNQRGGTKPSPEGALTPSTKYGYKERGYEAYANGNQYIIVSHQLGITCEDTNKSTTLLDIRYPFWDNQRGYVYNFAVLTL